MLDMDLVHPDENLEDLQLAGMKILQKKQGFRFGMDTVLLADFARIGKYDHVVDFGTGTGVLPLLLSGREKGREYTAFEIQPEMADMARRSAFLNGLDARMHVLLADVRQAHLYLHSSSIDHVICNPPYFPPGSAYVNPDPALSVSRHQGEDGIRPWLTEAMRILKGHGRFSLIYPAQRMLEVMQALESAHLIPKRFRLVYPALDKGANLVLIEAQKDAKPLLHTEPPLIVYDKDGRESEEIRRIYHMAEA
ncbi:MAG: methyltransferase [Clostridia bacterium]|nr:methyltransferase [Clostridia bacterium]